MKFSRRVLELVRKIPRGGVTTYRILAEKLKSKAYRAVGNALNKNKHPVLIPCHRVVNSDGSLGGYSGGIKRKIRLLKREGIKIRSNKIVDFDKKLFRF
ncbi:MAG TPA: MGMT family protein [Candidatus Nanoarchaeia archaeon]|nr:MGMT family protein [Candidatus Nanoarchaeia archaeon]